MIIFVSNSSPVPNIDDGASIRVRNLLLEYIKHDSVELVLISDLSGREYQRVDSFCRVSGIRLSYFRASRLASNVILKTIFPFRYISRPARFYLLDLYKNPSNFFFFEGLFSLINSSVRAIPLHRSAISAVDSVALAAYRQIRTVRGLVKRMRYVVLFFQRLLIEWFFFSKIETVFFVSADDAAFVRRFCDAAVVPNGVDTQYYDPALVLENKSEIQGRYVLFFGSFQGSMNVEAAKFLIQSVLPYLERLEIKLVCAGYKANTLMAATDVPRNCILIDSPPDPRILLAGAVCVVSPIKYGTGIKNTVLQSMAMEKVCIVTDLVAKPIGIEHGVNGYVEDRKHFKEVLVTLISNTIQHELGINAREHVQRNFSWASAAQQYLKHMNFKGGEGADN